MTGNQIAFAVHNETKRANLAREALGMKQLDETIRSNQAQEGIGWYNAQSSREHYERGDAEAKRHNLTTESLTDRYNQGMLGIQQSQLSEARRHNVNTENIQSAQVSESKRHNVTTEGQSGTKLTNDYDIAQRELANKSAGVLSNVFGTLGGILTGLLR